jgi:hypothetical protein
LEGFLERYILKPDIFPKTRYPLPNWYMHWTLGVNWVCPKRISLWWEGGVEEE